LRYSAASSAIQFLQSLHHDTGSQFRTIKLLEDKVSINNPPSHVQGLIPFGPRYSKLHIERSVNLWTAGICPGIEIRGERWLPLTASRITKSLGGSIFETLELRSFRLTLDGRFPTRRLKSISLMSRCPETSASRQATPSNQQTHGAYDELRDTRAYTGCFERAHHGGDEKFQKRVTAR
jgi:hypothetical protein